MNPITYITMLILSKMKFQVILVKVRINLTVLVGTSNEERIKGSLDQQIFIEYLMCAIM